MDALKQHLSFEAASLSLRAERNEILASNIANAATPGYRARDIDFTRELEAHLPDGPLRRTRSVHIPASAPPQGEDVLYRQPLNPSVDGNTVELAVEQTQFSENSVRYMTTLGFLNRRISGLMTAIRGE